MRRGAWSAGRWARAPSDSTRSERVAEKDRASKEGVWERTERLTWYGMDGGVN